MQRIRGKRVLVTGAAGGIGRAIARRLGREGARLALLDKDEQKLQAIDGNEFAPGGDLLRLACDLCDDDQIEAAADRLLREWGGLDILVNNAGVVYYGRTDAMSHDEWQQVLGANLLGPMRLTRLLLPHLLAEPEAHIVNVSSMYGYFATNRCSAYHATKFAIVGFSEALRAEYARRGLGVTVLCPAFVRTDLFTSMAGENGGVSIPPSWICTTAEKVAERAVRAIYRNRRLEVVGWLARATWWLRRIAPGLFDVLYHVGRRKRPQPAAGAVGRPTTVLK